MKRRKVLTPLFNEQWVSTPAIRPLILLLLLLSLLLLLLFSSFMALCTQRPVYPLAIPPTLVLYGFTLLILYLDAFYPVQLSFLILTQNVILGRISLILNSIDGQTRHHSSNHQILLLLTMCLLCASFSFPSCTEMHMQILLWFLFDCPSFSL